MPDPIFDDRRLATLYDPLDPDRSDLDAYAAIVEELGATSVLDVGCGTGTFACLLADQGVGVIGVDPAGSSLEVARAKPGAERVRWLQGDATDLPPLQVDLATMTANVAQVFLTDEEWDTALRGVRAALRPGGHLVFEVRDPAREAWRDWTRDRTWVRLDLPGADPVEKWCEPLGVEAELVSFRWTHVFAAEGTRIISDSTLRFRPRTDLERSLRQQGFTVVEVRDAPDRPGRELVFVARRQD